MPIPAIVLAGERPGGNPLAQAFGTPAGILVDVAGQSCAARVLTALDAAQHISGGIIVGPQPEVAALPEMRELLDAHPFTWLAPADGPAESAALALQAVSEQPVLITSADHALLTAEIIDEFCSRALASEADFVVGLVPYQVVSAAFPDSKRTLLKFADGTFCGSNLFMVRTAAGSAVVDFWQAMQAHRKRPWRMATELGAGILIRYLLGRLPLAQALARISELSGCVTGHVELPIARAAVDVDSIADHALAERVLSSC